jgi:oxalate decarboxylase
MQKTSQQHNDQPNRVPQPIRGNEGGTDPGPRNVPLDRQNPDILTPPSTDAGTIPNMKFSFGLAHSRLLAGGWTRQVTVRELPIATTLSGVDMHLNPGGVRELHWHNEQDRAQVGELAQAVQDVTGQTVEIAFVDQA